ncbi:isopeptide-forming domain-containing fimbrial protein [uncultured Microbulbifer sp.]|uniref:isopeptide-forming domain-containing fimbrial protein n=1 Tax=uncultured Microbulbifer sp. TaxID=348147 RepID=UPI0026329451|nr:isopeptide-forming domain-containing fimbrial protein [uncultured Microbulbifer sp.]
MKSEVTGRKTIKNVLAAVALACAGVLLPVGSALAQGSCPAPDLDIDFLTNGSYCELCAGGEVEINIGNDTDAPDFRDRDGGDRSFSDISVSIDLQAVAGVLEFDAMQSPGGAPSISAGGQVLSWNLSGDMDRNQSRTLRFSLKAINFQQEELVDISRQLRASVTYDYGNCNGAEDRFGNEYGGAPYEVGPVQVTEVLDIREPLPGIDKRGRNHDAGQTNYSNNVYGNINDDVIWRIRIDNAASVAMQDVRFDDLMGGSNMDIRYACPSNGAAVDVADNNGVAPPGSQCVPASNTVDDFELSNNFSSGPGVIDVPANGQRDIFLVGKVTSSCSNATNTASDLQWGCAVVPNGPGGISSPADGASPGADNEELRVLSSGELNIDTDITGTNLAQPLGASGFVTVTINNQTGGSVKDIDFTNDLPAEYVVDATYTPQIIRTRRGIDPHSANYSNTYPGMVDRLIWDNENSDPLLNNAPHFRLESTTQHPEYGDQQHMLRQGDEIQIRFRIVTIEPDFYDKVANLDVRDESPADGSDPDSNFQLAEPNVLSLRFYDFCNPGAERSQQVNTNVTPDPEDLDLSTVFPMYIVRDAGTSPLTVDITNNGGHDANDYAVYVTFGQAMTVDSNDRGCSAVSFPLAHPLWNSPDFLPSTATVFRCDSSHFNGAIAPGATERVTFQVRKNHNASDDDLTFRVDAVGEITLDNGDALDFPQPANLNGPEGTTPSQQLANNYTLDGVRAKVLGFNLVKKLSGQCTELNAPGDGFPNTDVIIGEDCKVEIHAGGWFGFETPGFSLIEVNNISVGDDLPDGQGYISDNRLSCGAVELPDPLSRCREIAGAVQEQGGLNQSLSEVDPLWVLVDPIQQRDFWFLSDLTTRVLNDPVDSVSLPNQHAADSIDRGRSAFTAVFESNGVTQDIRVDNAAGVPADIPGYPPESDWRVDLRVVEPEFEIEKLVCNETTSGGCASDSDFADNAEGTRFDTFIYKITVNNRNNDSGVPRAPGYDLVVIDNLDARGQMCVEDFGSDGLDNDGDGTDEADGAQEGFLGTAPFQNDYDIATHCNDGGTPAVISFRHDLSDALKRLDAGESVSFLYRVAPHQSVAPMQPFLNTTFARYDSLANEFGNQNAPQLESDANLDGLGDDLGAPNNSGRARHYETESTTANMQIIPVETQPKQAVTTATIEAGLVTPTSADSSALVVGEEVRYRLTAQIPPSRLRELTITDDLPEGLRCTDAPEVDLDAIAAAAGASFEPGGQFSVGDGGITCTDDSITWNFGLQDLTTAGGRRFDLPVDFFARLENTAQTNNGNVITNGGSATTAEVAYIDETGTQQRIAFESHSFTVLEPQIELQKTFDVSNADADDELTVTVTAENTGTAAAYNLQVLDDLVDSRYTYIGNIGGNDPPDSDNDGVNTNAPIFGWERSNSDYAIAPGESRSFTFQVRVNQDVAPHEVLPNTVEGRWQSLPGNDIALNSTGIIGTDGAVDGMRIGVLPNAGDAVNDYEITADAQTEVLPLTFTKTDLDDTVIPTIGAHKHFQLEIQLPEGISTEVSVSDLLNGNGAEYVLTHNSDYDITYEFIGIDTINGETPTEAAFTSFPVDGSTDPGTATWEIGTVDTAHEDDVVTSDLTPTIRIQYFARINNDTGTDAGSSLVNNATLNYLNPESGAPEALTASAPATTVVEPLLLLEKDVANLTNDGQPALGGDVLEYTVRVRHEGASTADAFDLNLVDTLPTELQLDDSFTVTAQIDGADVAGFNPVPDGAPLGPLVWGKNNGDNSLDLPLGSELVLVYRTQVRSVFGNPINNSITADWTSLNEDIAGEPEFERHGNGCPTITAPDDYCVGPVQAPIITDDNTAIEKTVAEDTDTETNIGTLRVGDFVTYRLQLSLQAGTTPAVAVQDTLPAGLVFDGVVSINGDTSAPYAPANGFDYAEIPASAVPAQGAEGVIDWTFGDVTREFTASAPLVIEYRVKVAEDNGIEHLPTQQLTNTAQLSYGSDTVEDNAVISLLQPVMDSLEKTERSGKPNPYNNIDLLNDIMQFRLHACNNGEAPAYNMQITDTLAMEMDETSIANVQVSIDGAPLLDGDYTYTAPSARGGNMVFVLNTPVPAGLCVDIDYDIGFHQDVGGDQSWVNTFAVDQYWSLPDASGQNYGPLDLPVPFAMSTAAAVVEPLTKALVTPDDGTATVGELVHYRITVPGVANDAVALRNVQVIDTLDSLGDIMTFESATLNGEAFDPVVDQAAGTFTFDIPSIAVSTVAEIDIYVRVADVATAVAGTEIVNAADFTYEEGASNLPGGGNDVSFTIVEPELIMDKTGPANVQAGLPGRFVLDVHNAGMGDAFELTLTDVLPQETDGGEAGGMCTTPPENFTAEILDAGGNAIAALSEGSDFTTSYDVDSCTLIVTVNGADASASVLPADHHLQFAYDAYLDTDTSHSATLTNIAGATQWFGLPVEEDQRRVYDRTLTDGSPDVVDFEDAFTITAQVPRVAFYKSVENITRVENPAVNAAPTDLLRYTITLTNEEDVSVDDFSVTDDLGRLNPAVIFESGTLNIISIPTGADSSATDASGGTNSAGLLDIRGLNLAAAGEAGDSIEIVFEVQLAAVIDNGTAVLNQAQLQLPGQSAFVSDDPNINGMQDPEVAGDEDPTRVIIESAPVFKVEKISEDLTGEPDSLMPGDTLRYTLRVENIGNENMLEASLRDQVPANTMYVAGSTTLNGAALDDVDGSTPLAQTLVIQSPGAEAGQLLADPDASGSQTALITFDVTINDVNDGTVISNQGFANGVGAGVDAGGENIPLDEQPSDDPATEVADDPTIDIVGNVPLIRTQKTVELVVDNMTAGIVDPEDVLRYTITVSNMGGKDATEARFVDLVPEYTTYVAGSTLLNGIAVADDGEESPLVTGIPISSEDLTPPMPVEGEGIITTAQTATIVFDVMVNAETERGTIISNQGNVYSLELPLTLTDADGNSSNGAQPTEVVVGDAQQLSITKEVAVVGGGAAESGEVLEYIVRVTNISAVPASLVTIYDDLLVAGEGVLTYVEDSARLNGQPDGVMVDGPLITVDYSTNYGDLQPSETITLRFQASLGEGVGEKLPLGYSVVNTAQVKWNDPPVYNEATVAIDIGGTPGIANLSGFLWHDVNFSETADSEERLLINWTVDLYFNNGLLETIQSDENGYFQFAGLVPNMDGEDVSAASYELRYRAPNAVESTASLGIASSDYTNGPQRISNIYIGSGANPQNLNLPITPNGVIYDSILRAPVAGARVSMLQGSSGQPLPDSCFDDPAQQNQVTLPGGYYKFDLNFSSAACAVNADYLIDVDVPSDQYTSGPSRVIPPQTGSETGSFDVSACLGSAGDTIPGTPDHCEVQLTELPPPIDMDARSSETDYYLRLNLDDTNQPGSSQLYNNHIALDPLLEGALALTKTSAMTNVTRSQLVPYTITFTNTMPVPLTDLQLVDYFPAGFKYVAGSANLDGMPVEPEVNGLQLQWPHLRAEGEATRTMKLLLVVGSGVGEGKYVNRARMFNELSGQQASGEASATVRVVPDPTFDCTDVVGKVYDDKNLNGYQDNGEGGVAGARVVTAQGLRATTDAHGRFHITCAAVPNPDRGSNFVLKLDDRSLPSGYRLTTENPRVQRATRGKMLEFNFGTSLHRVVRLDLAEAVFEPGSTELRPQWRSRTELLLERLQEDPSVLRLSYLAENEDSALVDARLEAIKARIAEDWAALDCCYPLNIETEIFWRRGAPPERGSVLDGLKRSVNRMIGSDDQGGVR